MKSRSTVLLTMFFIFFLNIKLIAQDLIVTFEGDSINCKITQILDERIFFSYFNKGERVKTMVSMQDVRYYETNYYVDNMESVPYYRRDGHSAFDVVLGGGYTYRTASIDPNLNQFLKDYIKGIKSGFVIGADAVYYFTDQYGAGLKYNSAFYSNRVDNVIITYPDGTVRNGTVSDRIHISFIGPAFHTRKFTGMTENCLSLSMAIGYMKYYNDSKVIDPIIFNSETLGIAVDASYEFQLGDATSLGVRLSYVTGTLTELDVEDNTGSWKMKLEPGQYESLTRIDAQAVLKIRLF